jgi:hypothetical protein
LIVFAGRNPTPGPQLGGTIPNVSMLEAFFTGENWIGVTVGIFGVVLGYVHAE